MYHTKKLVAVCMMMSVAVSTATSFFPQSLNTLKGSASQTSLTSLQTYDQTGSEDKWDDYVEFYSSPNNYVGVFTFDVSAVNPADVTAYTLNVNFKGDKKSQQEWQFQYLSGSGSALEMAGNNAAARNWKWSNLTFPGTVPFAALVSLSGELQLQLNSVTAVDNCDIDFLELDVQTSGDASLPTEEPTEEPTEAPTEEPTEEPSAAPDNQGHGNGNGNGNHNTPKPTPKPTSKPTKKPTPAPTKKPTKAPTSAPTKKATPAPTTKPTKGSTPAPSTPAPSSSGSASGSSGSSSGLTYPAVTLGPQRLCPAGSHYQPGPQTTWQWQLQGTIDQTIDAQMYDIDMFDSSQTLINSLHTAGRAVTCYIDTAYEPGRPDSSDFTAAVKGNAIQGWPGQCWVDTRSAVVRQIMVNRIAMAASKGCDGVELDDVDAYQNDPGFPLDATTQADFNSFLAATAHQYNMGIALKNDVDQVKTLAADFDYAINEQCHQFDECGDYSTYFIANNKAVFGAEYSLATSKFCDASNTDKFSFDKKTLDLTATVTICCPTCSGSYTCVPDATTNIEAESIKMAVTEDAAPSATPSSATQVAGAVFAVVIALFAVVF